MKAKLQDSPPSATPPSPSWRWRSLVPGLLLTTAIALVATALSRLPSLSLLSPLILGIVLGIAVRNVLGPLPHCRPGIVFSLKRLLRLAIILLGLQLSFAQVLLVGPVGLAIAVVTLVSTFIFTCWLGRYLGINRQLAQLIAAGTSICGASAVVATGSVVESSDEDVTYAVSIVTIFGTISLFTYPVLAMVLKLTPEAFGIWCGVSIHEVAQVVAAAFQTGEMSGELATVAKLSRVLFLVPMLLGLGFLSARKRRLAADRPGQPLPIPWFVLGFIALIGVNSLDVIPLALKDHIIQGNRFLLTISLTAMGLETSLRKIWQIGHKPFYLGAASWLFIAVLSLILVKLFYI
ncbi:MAG: YeiH family putative sulfate export transporter [Chloroflexaceae bacterium]|nr:YeiH family putative sulfate export transporter [Chloroflexaceae bacterium]